MVSVQEFDRFLGNGSNRTPDFDKMSQLPKVLLGVGVVLTTTLAGAYTGLFASMELTGLQPFTTVTLAELVKDISLMTGLTFSGEMVGLFGGIKIVQAALKR